MHYLKKKHIWFNLASAITYIKKNKHIDGLNHLQLLLHWVVILIEFYLSFGLCRLEQPDSTCQCLGSSTESLGVPGIYRNPLNLTGSGPGSESTHICVPPGSPHRVGWQKSVIYRMNYYCLFLKM